MATQVVARDDGRIGDEMTLAGIAKQLQGIRSDLDAVRSDVTALRGDMTGVRADVTTLRADETAVRADVTTLRADVTAVREDVKAVDVRVESLDHKTKIEFEETRRVVRLGFENVQMLDEKIDRRFDDTDRAHTDHQSLLEAAVVGLRREMTKPRRPGRRR